MAYVHRNSIDARDPTARYVQLAREAARALRGPLSQSECSRRLGYQSNVMHRWESGTCLPKASVFLRACEDMGRGEHAAVRFLNRRPAWLTQHAFATKEGVRLFLGELLAGASQRELAARMGKSRFQVMRVISGGAEPNLAFFLHLVDETSHRALDLLSMYFDVERFPSFGHAWRQLELARAVAYDEPWSHAVLRALELDPKRHWKSARWVSGKIGLPVEQVRTALEKLAAAGQVRKRKHSYRLVRASLVDTSRDPTRARRLRLDWCKAATARLERGTPGFFGYDLFAVSREDLLKLRDLQSQYVRAMQQLISASNQPECVGLYCAQLLDLAETDNAFTNRTP